MACMKLRTAFFSLFLVSAAACGSPDHPAALPDERLPDGGPTDAGGIDRGSVADARPDIAAEAAAEANTCLLNRFDIAAKLTCIPGLGVQELHLPPDAGGDANLRYFLLNLDQPVDHDNPTGPHFRQRLLLRHRSEGAPLVLTSGGYELFNFETDLSLLFATNTLEVEHRYFGTSIPSPVDWKFLDIKQAAADYHAITVALKAIYGGKWVGTGASKGGMASVYHRRFWPADVDATVAYVTPNSYGTEDPRYPQFLATVGGDHFATCRDDLKAMQIALLTQRADVLPLMTGQYDSFGGKDVALENAVRSVPFGFWQYGDAVAGCPILPKAGAPLRDTFNVFDEITQIQAYTNQPDTSFEAYAYQALTQLGAPGTDDEYLSALIKYPDTYGLQNYAPKMVLLPWDGEAMKDIQNWVTTESKTLMFIYGEVDPWSAGKFTVPTTAANDNHLFVAPLGNHGAGVATLWADDQIKSMDILQRWLGVPPMMQAPLHAQRPAMKRRFFAPIELPRAR
jgi:hypothetical protein